MSCLEYATNENPDFCALHVNNCTIIINCDYNFNFVYKHTGRKAVYGVTQISSNLPTNQPYESNNVNLSKTPTQILFPGSDPNH